MPTYLSLVSFTQQGIQNIKESPARLDAAKKAFKAMGGELKHFYLTLGRYDIVLIGEHPNDETAAKVALATGEPHPNLGPIGSLKNSLLSLTPILVQSEV